MKRHGQAFSTIMMVVALIVILAILAILLSIYGSFGGSSANAKDTIPLLASRLYFQGSLSEVSDNVAFDSAETITRPDAVGALPIQRSLVIFACAKDNGTICGKKGTPIEISNGTMIISHEKAVESVGACINQTGPSTDQFLVIIGDNHKFVQEYIDAHCRIYIPTPRPTPTTPSAPLPGPGMPSSVPTPYDTPTPAPPLIHKKYLLISVNPVMPDFGNVRVNDYFHWNDPYTLATGFVSDIKEDSHNSVEYSEAARIDTTDFIAKSTGFTFDDNAYAGCVNNHGGPNCADMIDYNAFLEKYNVCDWLNNGSIDEVWVFGGPWMGMYESNQAGTGAFWTNGPVIAGTSCSRILNIFGFNPERGVAEMDETMGHRVEGTMAQIYGGWKTGYSYINTPINSYSGLSTWDNFTLTEKKFPGHSQCGFVHYAPNSNKDYDWANPAPVVSGCDDWMGYPSLTGATQTLTCVDWGCNGYDYAREQKKWWFAHIPHSSGTAPDGKLANWWVYVGDYENADNYR